MATRGQKITNPITGETITFQVVSADSGGELLRLDFALRPQGFVPVAHVHPHQQERFEILAGDPSFSVNGVTRKAQAGQTVVVPPGVPHQVWNAAPHPCQMKVEFRPALETEKMFEMVFKLAVTGKLNRKGIPGPLASAVLFTTFREEVLPASRLLNFVASLVLPPMAGFGQLLGYRI